MSYRTSKAAILEERVVRGILSVVSTVEKRVAQRISIRLPNKTLERLKRWAAAEGASVSYMASYVIRKATDEAEKEGKLADLSAITDDFEEGLEVEE